MLIELGDRVRYSEKFLAAHSDLGMVAHFSELEGTVVALMLIEEELMAQVDFGSAFRATSLVRASILEVL